MASSTKQQRIHWAASNWPTAQLHYGITPEGLLQLKAELKRLQHAVKIGESAGHLVEAMPPDIQRLLNQLT